MGPENNLIPPTPDEINPVLEHFGINPDIEQIPGTWLQPGTIICVQYPDDKAPLWLCVLSINQTIREFNPINHQNRIIYPISANAPLIYEIERQVNPEQIQNTSVNLQIRDNQITVTVLEIITPMATF